MQNSHSPLTFITPFKHALIHGVAQKLPVLVRIQAPDAPVCDKCSRKPYLLPTYRGGIPQLLEDEISGEAHATNVYLHVTKTGG